MSAVTCEKCGRDDINIVWHGPGGSHRTRRFADCASYAADWGKPAAEHLHYGCRTCGFSWTGDVHGTPAPEAPPESAPDSSSR